MKNILDLLTSSFGLHINMNDNINPIVLIAVGYFIFNLIILFSIINISILF